MPHVIDPVCGMPVDTASAAWKTSHNGSTYYFCTEACKQAFDGDSTRYTAATVGDTPGGREEHEPPFTVSGGVAAPKFGSAGSGGAEYEVLPEAHDPKKG